ncbi:hypothetical protein [Ramlibacter sp. 2FC]|uniref:hypothetical protein n=1 Tax=Ramlibacter sp. 2FC TaxID=2502188 RepID=UPI0010F87836|nr:hypothetical protein [Ramlibacter sp. 2FC]
MRNIPQAGVLLATLLLGACAVVPSAPSVMVLPGTGKSFDQFRFDDANCRNYAYAQVGGAGTNQAATNTAVGSAVVGTAVGALAGAALGGDSRGAAAGAGAGLLLGSAAGAGTTQRMAYGSQRAYDTAYVQCMYAAGHRVPIYGRMVGPPGPASPPPPPPPSYPR